MLHQLADEIRETFEDRGWKIEQAIEQDSAFRRSRRSQSALGRELVLDAVETGCGRLGISLLTVSGGACDLVICVDGVYRYLRVRKASVDPDTGTYSVIGNDSILTIEDGSDSLFSAAERWILGYTVEDDGMVVDIFCARVRGVTDDSVSRLILGPPTLLGTALGTPPSDGGFRPADEDDLNFGDESDEEGGVSDAM